MSQSSSRSGDPEAAIHVCSQAGADRSLRGARRQQRSAARACRGNAQRQQPYPQRLYPARSFERGRCDQCPPRQPRPGVSESGHYDTKISPVAPCVAKSGRHARILDVHAASAGAMTSHERALKRESRLQSRRTRSPYDVHRSASLRSCRHETSASQMTLCGSRSDPLVEQSRIDPSCRRPAKIKRLDQVSRKFDALIRASRRPQRGSRSPGR